jgi:hypothetical protein
MSSSSTDDNGSDLSPVPWESLSSTRKRIAKVIAYISGPGKFDRPTLKEEVEKSENIGNIIADKDSLMTSLSYTRNLNNLVEDEYLLKTHQGGQNPVVIDTKYRGKEDEIQSAPLGAASELQDIIYQVKERENIPEGRLSDIDLYDANEVINAVNNIVGETVLVMYSEPSKYMLPLKSHEKIISRIESEVNFPVLTTNLYKTHETITEDTFTPELKAVVNSIHDETVTIRITKDGSYVDEAIVQENRNIGETDINSTFDIIYIGGNRVQLVYNDSRTEETKKRIREIIQEHRERLITPEEWRE